MPRSIWEILSLWHPNTDSLRRIFTECTHTACRCRTINPGLIIGRLTMSAAYILYKVTPDGTFQFSCAAPPYHIVQYTSQSILYVFEMARQILQLEQSVPELLKNARYRAFLQHLGRFAITTAAGVYLVPVNRPENLPYTSVGIALPEDDMRRVWSVSSVQQLDLRQEAANFGTVIPGAKYALFNFLDTTYWPGIGDALYLESFGRVGGPWSTYLPAKNELPKGQEMVDLKGVVLSGGIYCAFDKTLAWAPAAEQWVRTAVEENIKLIGLCFGCQFTAKALGGTVTQNPCKYFLFRPDRVSYSGFIASRLRNPVLYVSECHNDCVAVLPPGAELLGTSDSTAIEVWGIEGKVISSQGHPEFSTAFMTHFWLPTLHEDRKITAAQKQEGIQLYQEKMPGGPLLHELSLWLRE